MTTLLDTRTVSFRGVAPVRITGWAFLSEVFREWIPFQTNENLRTELAQAREIQLQVEWENYTNSPVTGTVFLEGLPVTISDTTTLNPGESGIAEFIVSTGSGEGLLVAKLEVDGELRDEQAKNIWCGGNIFAQPGARQLWVAGYDLYDGFGFNFLTSEPPRIQLQWPAWEDFCRELVNPELIILGYNGHSSSLSICPYSCYSVPAWEPAQWTLGHAMAMRPPFRLAVLNGCSSLAPEGWPYEGGWGRVLLKGQKEGNFAIGLYRGSSVYMKWISGSKLFVRLFCTQGLTALRAYNAVLYSYPELEGYLLWYGDPEVRFADMLGG